MAAREKRRRPGRARTEANDELTQRLADLQRIWQVGDACFALDHLTETTIRSIDGETVTLTNGEVLHITKLWSVTTHG